MTALIEQLNRSGDAFLATAGQIVVQSSALILLLLLIQPILRRRVRASVRYAIWMLVPIKLLLPPAFALPTSAAYWLAPARAVAAVTDNRPTLASRTDTASLDADRAAPAVRQTTNSPSVAPSALLFLMWAGGIAGLGGWIARGHFRSRRLVRASTEAPPELVELAEACHRELGMRGHVAVRCSESATTPALYGLTSPTIVIPASIVHLGSDMLRPVVIHELAHHRRGDIWMNQVLLFAQLLHWFNPLTWIAGSVIRRTREEAVDDEVLGQMRGEEATYADTLLHIAKNVVARRLAISAGTVGIIESGSALRRRIERVLSSHIPPGKRLGWPALCVMVCVACIVLPMAPGRTVVAQGPASAVTEDTPSLLEPFLVLIPGYEEMRRRQLLDRVAAHPDDVTVLMGAADALMVSDRARAQELLARASALEPENAAVAGKLAQLHSLRAQTARRPEDVRLALEYAEKEQRLKPGGSAMYLKLGQLAFDAGELTKARDYANAYLESARTSASTHPWATGDLVHKGNLVLGRIAVREGRLDDAEHYLRASADTSGSPVLNSFGPNMSLAKDLLEAGRSGPVLEYFDACSRFWRLNFFKLGRWASTVRAGEIPEFGANLVY